MTDMQKKPALVIEPDRVIMVGEEWPSEIVCGVQGSWTENIEEFNEAFETFGKGKEFLARPKEDFYQGATFMTVIRRKSDGRLFGYERWDAIGKNASSDAEPEANGDKHGLESEWNEDFTECVAGPYWVWLPVEPFTVTGYKFLEK